MSEIKFMIINNPRCLFQVCAELDGMTAHIYSFTESEIAHILSTFLLVGEDVKSAAMVEFRKMDKKGEK